MGMVTPDRHRAIFGITQFLIKRQTLRRFISGFSLPTNKDGVLYKLNIYF